jgi:lipopolysaccharide transport protein LptA
MNGRRPPRGRRLFWTVVAFLAVASLLAFFLLRSRGGAGARKIEDPEIEGVDLTYYDFDRNNRKKLEIQCRESQKQGDDRLRMKGVKVTIFDTEKQKDDLHVTAEAGTFSNNFHDFFIQGKARIFSSDFSLFSPSFNLKDRDILTSREKVRFTLETAHGEAASGLCYYINHKVLKLFDCDGVWVRDELPYDFRCRFFWVFKKKNSVILKGDAELAGNHSTLRSGSISMQFTDGFDSLQTTNAIGKSYFHHQANAGLETEQEREISANVIKMQNDAQGRPQLIHANGKARIVLIDPASQGQLESDEIEIQLNAETQNLEMVRVLQPGSLSTRGKENVVIGADSLQAVYDKQGQLSRVRAEGKCQFATDDFTGSAASLDHDAANSLIQIVGDEASITSKKNTFSSSSFSLNTKLKKLGSEKGVKATLVPGKKSILLQARPVFVTSAALETSDKGNASLFKGKVRLFQDQVLLQAEELLFDSLGGKMACRGGADLKFVDEGELVMLHGTAIDVDPEGTKMVIEGQAQLRQGENTLSAQTIELAFNRSEKLENITASGDAAFSRKDLSGKAQRVHWQYAKKTIWFRKSAEITRKGAGTTRGQELRFDMESNRITVTGSDDRSQTTIGKERP